MAAKVDTNRSVDSNAHDRLTGSQALFSSSHCDRNGHPGRRLIPRAADPTSRLHLLAQTLTEPE